jgi:hypothetical protein
MPIIFIVLILNMGRQAFDITILKGQPQGIAPTE